MAPLHIAREELRMFGLVLGSASLIPGLWWWYAGRFGVASTVLFVAGGVLLVSAAVAPQRLRRFHHAWSFLGEGMSFVMTRLILFGIFFLVVTPIGWIRRLAGADPLGRRSGTRSSYWERYSPRQHDSRHYENMF